MNTCVLILYIIPTILVVAKASEVEQLKRLQTEPCSSNKKSKTDELPMENNEVENEKKLYVAVIGGGLNAALFTHYLHKIIKAEVHIYNHGMIQKTENSLFVVHESQKYMMEIISELNLDTKDLNQPIVMYDGQKNAVLNFQENDPIKLFIELNVKRLVPKFEKIYDIQQKELRSFINLYNLLFDMCETFPKMLQNSTREFIIKKQRRKKHLNLKEIIHSLLLLNYGQNLESNAFAGLTSLIFSQSTGKLKRITTPIGKLVKKLVDESDKLFDLDVLNVTHVKVSKFAFRPLVSWISKDGKKLNRIYDYVVMATSEINDIYSGFKKPISVCQNRNMVFTTVTSSLKEEVFKNSNTVIAIANVKDSGSIRLAYKISNSEWKIVSDDDVSNEISSIFNVTGTAMVSKMALWPDYSDKKCAFKATFVLGPRVFYLNAIEGASSLLEMKAIGAINVALRIKNIQEQVIIVSDPARKGW